MDLSNREEARLWHKRAEEVTDPDLRKEALAACRKYRKLAEREEKLRLKRQRPGYGVRSMIGWIILLALCVLTVILWLSKVFSVVVVCSVFASVLALCLIAAAVTLRVYGHVSEDGMLAMIQHGLQATLGTTTQPTTIEAKSASNNVKLPSNQRELPSAPSISFDTSGETKLRLEDSNDSANE